MYQCDDSYEFDDGDELFELVGLEAATLEGNRGRMTDFNTSYHNESVLDQTFSQKVAVPVPASRIPQYLGSSYGPATADMGAMSPRPYAPTSRLPGPSTSGSYRQEEPAQWKSSYRSRIPVADGTDCACSAQGVYTARPYAPESSIPYPRGARQGASAGPGNFNVVPGRSQVGGTYSRSHRSADPPFVQTQKVSLQGANQQPKQDFNMKRDILNMSYKGIPYYNGIKRPEIIHFDWERRQSY